MKLIVVLFVLFVVASLDVAYVLAPETLGSYSELDLACAAPSDTFYQGENVCMSATGLGSTKTYTKRWKNPSQVERKTDQCAPGCPDPWENVLTGTEAEETGTWTVELYKSPGPGSPIATDTFLLLSGAPEFPLGVEVVLLFAAIVYFFMRKRLG